MGLAPRGKTSMGNAAVECKNGDLSSLQSRQLDYFIKIESEVEETSC
jgi:hypothetical protein